MRTSATSELGCLHRLDMSSFFKVHAAAKQYAMLIRHKYAVMSQNWTDKEKIESYLHSITASWGTIAIAS